MVETNTLNNSAVTSLRIRCISKESKVTEKKKIWLTVLEIFQFICRNVLFKKLTNIEWETIIVQI